MSTSKKPQCKRCGASAPSRSSAGLCPACLLSGALAPSRRGDETVTLGPGEAMPYAGYSEFPFGFGGYRLLGFLGSGGMGTVYEAEQVATGRRVALKMLGQQLDSPAMRQRFLREGRLAAGVNHPNSLYIFGSEEIEGLPVITMEIAGGGTLKDRLEKRGPLPPAEAVDAMLDVIAGLEAAFAAGVLHRDIKPSNCFVGPEGSVKVGDFGLSVSTLTKEDSYATASGVIMGTPAYAAPEQLRGDELDVRADIYSVGATLFTLLSGQAPFSGQNAVQVVAKVVNEKPRPLTELCDNVPPELERVVSRCLAKEPEGRYDGYAALRDALLPFSSREPEPASMKVRVPAGWIDYLIAFLVPYVVLMLAVGNEEFHLRFFMDRTLYAARHHLTFLGFGLLYFTLVEGLWGAGLGKRAKRLRVVRPGGRSPGIGRAFLRILVPVLCVEGVRIPVLMAALSSTRIDDMTTFEVVAYSVATSLAPFIPIVFALTAGPKNGFATGWDRLSGTRVVVKPTGAVRAPVESMDPPERTSGAPTYLGPYEIVEKRVPGDWIVATDPVLRRTVWLLRRDVDELPLARRDLGRSGRLRWLQKVADGETTWDAFEATRGVPFSSLVAGGKRLPWHTLRGWLHDLASEVWLGASDRTLPGELSLDHVWITTQGHAVLLDRAWPGVERAAERMPVEDLASQQRFLNAVAAHVDSTGLPLHARPVLQNLADAKFEKLSFLTGTLRGLLDRPAEVSKGVRAGSIFMLPLYTWTMIFVGVYQGDGPIPDALGSSLAPLVLNTTLLVLAAWALLQLLGVPFRSSLDHSLFRLAVVDALGEPARVPRMLARWAIAWVPLLLSVGLSLLVAGKDSTVGILAAFVLVLAWIGLAVGAVIHPNRGLHDLWSGCWVVRR